MVEIVLHNYQQDLKQRAYNSWALGNKNVLVVLPTGGGKCYGKNTPIMMFDGTVKKVQEIVVGDVLIGPDSLPRIVAKTCKGVDQLYEVKPVKGDSYVVNSTHVLSLKRTAVYSGDPRKGEIVNIEVADYLNKSNHFKHVHKGWRSSIDWQPSKPLDFDPYMLGLWLGDGTSRTPSITTPDSQIEKYCYEFAKKHDMSVRVDECGEKNCRTLHFKKHCRGFGKSYFDAFLTSNNLIQNKHIPHRFKTASKGDRFKLLAAIIDTDGHWDGKGYDLTLKHENLLDDVIFIARSLGFSCYKTKCVKGIKELDFEGEYYRCYISGDLDEIPTIVPHKKASPRKQIKDVLVTGIKVTPFEIGEYFGFELIGPDRLHLLADFTVSHNSVIMSDFVLDGTQQNLTQAVIAHRNELVTQMSCHLANRGIYHRIIGSKTTVKQAAAEHRKKFGKSFVHPTANTAVIGVDTLIARYDQYKDWAIQVDRWIIDEAHHVLKDNKWGKAVKMFPNAHGLGVTATPCRADGHGLSRETDGVFDDMVVGPSMRWLIENNFLSDYEVVCPESDMRYEDKKKSKNGDWTNKALKEAASESKIVGDTVQNYIKYAAGRKAIVFATDIETASNMAENFRSYGINAVSLNGKSAPAYRAQSLEQFRTGEIPVLINVDLFDEGFDVPDCEVCIMARPTASLGKYRQMVGRALRYIPNKTALTIDQVSNIVRHGLPDKETVWSLGRKEKQSRGVKDPDDIPMTICLNETCVKPYEKFRTCCPYCGTAKPLPEPRNRNVEMVEGDLILLDIEALRKMREATIVEDPASVAERVKHAAGPIAGQAALNRQIAKKQEHDKLIAAIQQWAGIERHRGFSDSEINRKFYLTMGTDVLTVLNGSRTAKEMEASRQIIEGWYS